MDEFCNLIEKQSFFGDEKSSCFAYTFHENN